MSSNIIYYVYFYLRSKDSQNGKAGTPYYIGKDKKKGLGQPIIMFIDQKTEKTY